MEKEQWMSEELLLEKVGRIKPRNKDWEEEARKILENKVKPVGSLGALEDMAAAMAGIFASLDFEIEKKANIIFCSDNGVFEEGYNKYPQKISRLVTEIMAMGKGGGAVIGSSTGAEIRIVNLGIKGKLQAENIVDRVINPRGTANIVKSPAMPREEVCRAIQIGMEQAEDFFARGVQVITAGEIGLGNTTTSAAVIAAITGKKAEEVTGMGSGCTKETLAKKTATVARALQLHQPEADDPIGVISKVGGYDIAAMAGVMLAAALHKKVMVIDGIISQAAALCAVKLNPYVKDYLLPSHLSGEKGAGPAFESLGMKPVLHLGMRLGEGTGSCLLFPILDAAANVLKTMASFDDLALWFPEDWPDDAI